jgi:hypothetical protein
MGRWLSMVQFVQIVQMVQNVLNGLTGLNILNPVRRRLADRSIHLFCDIRVHRPFCSKGVACRPRKTMSNR